MFSCTISGMSREIMKMDGRDGAECQNGEMEGFRERRTSFSLENRKIRPSADFGVRRENDLRGTGYAWTPVLVSFFKLFKVGFSPYLGFILIFSVFRMFESIGAIRGGWIGPKTWDRINTIFLKPNGAACSCSTAVWV